VEPIICSRAAAKHVRVETQLNILDTLHAVAHDYKGGCESLAPRVGMSAAVLRSKVNPNTETHKPTLMDAVNITEMADDDRVLEAWARQRGKALIDLPTADNCADSDVIEMMSESMKTFGDIGNEITKTFADGRVETREARRVRDAIWTHLSKLFGLSNRIEGMAEK
jgi:hypothetical protein